MTAINQRGPTSIADRCASQKRHYNYGNIRVTNAVVPTAKAITNR